MIMKSSPVVVERVHSVFCFVGLPLHEYIDKELNLQTQSNDDHSNVVSNFSLVRCLL